MHRRQLPNRENAQVSRDKLIDYLLSSEHPDGRTKARFFAAFGFSADEWQQFALALATHAQEHVVARVESSPFGVRYVIDGILRAPDGREPMVRTVWFIESDETIPRWVTAYPLSKR